MSDIENASPAASPLEVMPSTSDAATKSPEKRQTPSISVPSIDIAQKDIDFLVACLQHTTGGSISIDTRAVAEAKGFKNHRSVGNKILDLKKRYNLPFLTSSTNSNLPRSPATPRRPKKPSDSATQTSSNANPPNDTTAPASNPPRSPPSFPNIARPDPTAPAAVASAIVARPTTGEDRPAKRPRIEGIGPTFERSPLPNGASHASHAPAAPGPTITATPPAQPVTKHEAVVKEEEISAPVEVKQELSAEA